MEIKEKIIMNGRLSKQNSQMIQGHWINRNKKKWKRRKSALVFIKFKVSGLKKKKWSKVVILHTTDQIPNGKIRIAF